MTLRGAEILLYPTAFGSEPFDNLDTSGHWRRVIQGHAAANIVPICVSNRVGTEKGGSTKITFYGSSFIMSPDGAIVAQANRTEEKVLIAAFDLDSIRRLRESFHLFRDRRPEHYYGLLTMDGINSFGDNFRAC